MTRKDYVLIAAALARSAARKDSLPDDLHEAAAQHRRDCEELADALARENGRFDRARFMRACGIEG